MVGIFLLPIGPSIEIKNNNIALGIKTNKAEAETTSFKDKFNADIILDYTNGIASNSVAFTVNLRTKENGAFLNFVNKIYENKIGIFGTYLSDTSNFYAEVNTDPSFKENSDLFAQPTWKEMGYDNSLLHDVWTPGNLHDQKDSDPVVFNATIAGLKPETHYYARFVVIDTDKTHYTISNVEDFMTPKLGVGPTSATTSSITNASVLSFNCALDNFPGCIARFTQAIWEVSALVMNLAAYFLDFLVYYSTNSSTYNNDFVKNGWSILRDIANILFIVGLLYIAIEMILGLSKNKKIIGYIVIAALLVNFSLFFTQVIIDGSNILAKVFYNNMDSKDNAGNIVTGGGGQKSISMGLVQKFSPQNLLSPEVYKAEYGTTKFILLTIVLIAISLYCAYTFFIIGLLFVSRVVMLWISMILAPFSFASYGLPFEIPGMGHKDWWKELINNSILAPIFIFFMYITVTFTGFLGKIMNSTGGNSIGAGTGADFFQHIMYTIVPAFILFVFIMKAKDIAVKYSGELGAQISKLGKGIGGLVVGGAVAGGIGLAAGAGRQTIGKAGNALANSKFAKDGGMLGRMAGNAGNFLGKSSFDARGIKVVGSGLAAAGMTGGVLAGALAAKQGGFKGYKEKKLAKRQAVADRLKVGENEGLSQEVKKAKAELKAVQSNTQNQIDVKEKNEEIRTAELKATGVTRELAGLERALQDAINRTRNSIGTDKHDGFVREENAARDDRNIKASELDGISKNTQNLKEELRELGSKERIAEFKVKQAESAVTTETSRRQTAYVEDLNNRGGEINKEAANNIRAGIKVVEMPAPSEHKMAA